MGSRTGRIIIKVYNLWCEDHPRRLDFFHWDWRTNCGGRYFLSVWGVLDDWLRVDNGWLRGSGLLVIVKMISAIGPKHRMEYAALTLAFCIGAAIGATLLVFDVVVTWVLGAVFGGAVVTGLGLVRFRNAKGHLVFFFLFWKGYLVFGYLFWKTHWRIRNFVIRTFSIEPPPPPPKEEPGVYFGEMAGPANEDRYSDEEPPEISKSEEIGKSSSDGETS